MPRADIALRGSLPCPCILTPQMIFHEAGFADRIRDWRAKKVRVDRKERGLVTNAPAYVCFFSVQRIWSRSFLLRTGQKSRTLYWLMRVDVRTGDVCTFPSSPSYETPSHYSCVFNRSEMDDSAGDSANSEDEAFSSESDDSSSDEEEDESNEDSQPVDYTPRLPRV